MNIGEKLMCIITACGIILIIMIIIIIIVGITIDIATPPEVETCNNPNGTITDNYTYNYQSKVKTYMFKICVDGEKVKKEVDNITYNQYLTGEITSIKY